MSQTVVHYFRVVVGVSPFASSSVGLVSVSISESESLTSKSCANSDKEPGFNFELLLFQFVSYCTIWKLALTILFTVASGGRFQDYVFWL